MIKIFKTKEEKGREEYRAKLDKILSDEFEKDNSVTSDDIGPYERAIINAYKQGNIKLAKDLRAIVREIYLKQRDMYLMNSVVDGDFLASYEQRYADNLNNLIPGDL